MSSFTVQIEDNPVKSIQIETSIGNNPASLEVQTFDNNIIQIEDGLTFTPLLVSNLLNATISQFLQAGSGISLASGVDSLTINSFTLPHVHNTNDIIGLVSAIQQNSTVKDILASSGISVISNSGIYSIALSNPNLQSSNILDFAQAVSGLLPITNVFAGSGISVTKSGTNYTVAVTGEFGLTPEQVDDRVSSLLFAGSNITLNYDDNANTLTISTSGLQPSGNYANLMHTHTSSNITDFNSSVSGLLPITNILGGTNISVVPNGSQFTVSVSGQLGLTSEEVDDRVSELLIAGSGIVLNYNDNANSLVILTSGLQPSGNYSIVGHNHGSNDITDFNSSVSGLINGIYAPLNSPSLTGVPIAPTAPSGTSNNQIANTQFVRTEISNNLEQKANLSGAIFTGSISGPSGDFNILRQSGINVSVSGHAHSYTDITNFASGIDESVSTLLLAGNNINLNYDNINDTLTISTTGLQPSGNYSVVGHTHAISDIISLQTTLDGKQASGNYAASSHTHTSSNITDFNSSVSGLLPTVANSGDNRILTSTGTSNGINAENNLTFDGSLLSVSGNLVVNSGTLNSITFNNIGDLNLSDRQLAWNSSEGSLALALSNTYDMYLGSELHYRVRNETGAPIIAGTAVYASGVAGGSKRITVAPKTADGSIRETRFMGLVTENINNGVNGFTTRFGYIRNIDTRGDYVANGATNKIWASGEPVWAEGDILYVHPTAEGKLTKIEPKHSISVAIILNRHQSEGKLFVRPTSYGHLDDNHDVSVSGATNGQFLQYNSATDYWIPSSSGNFTSLSVNNTIVSVSGHTHTTSDITDFNSSVSGLLPVKNVIGSGYIGVSSSSGDYTVFATGLQPSGNYANTSHTHILNDITNINGNRGDISVSNSGLNWLLNNGVVNTQHLNNEIIIDCGLILSSSSDFMHSKDKVYNWHE
jgi:hypothetical protein